MPKTSVYLSSELAAAWKASGRSLTDLVRAGLAADTEPIEATLRRVIREEIAALPAGAGLLPSRPAHSGPAGDCPHPKARVHKGLCGACGTNVG